MSEPRYIIGIDLGTTNSALAYIDTGAGQDKELTVAALPIPQLVQAGTVAERPLLPSFLYLPGANELPAGSLKLPWDTTPEWAAGEFSARGGVVGLQASNANAAQMSPAR